jgi:SAM-dependent methyltransferase
MVEPDYFAHVYQADARRAEYHLYSRAMSQELAAVADFYASPRGLAAAAILGRAIGAHWPDLHRHDVLGVGYPAPVLGWINPRGADVAQARLARRRFVGALTHHQPQPLATPASGTDRMAGTVCVAEPDHLPFPDLAFDRIVLVHGVEVAASPERLVREAWRLLRDDGRLLVIVANRTGLWAHAENTPFGHGQPYSQAQVDRLLARGMFRPERHSRALFVPPTNWSFLIRSQATWEHAGQFLLPQLAGVVLTEAIKDAYAAVPIMAPAKRRVVLPEAA